MSKPACALLDSDALSVRGQKDEDVPAVLEELRAKTTEVQSVLCAKSRFETVARAREWVKSHGFRADKVDDRETGDHFRFRQFEPSECEEDSERTIDLTKGVKAVICKKRGKASAEDPDGADVEGGVLLHRDFEAEVRAVSRAMVGEEDDPGKPKLYELSFSSEYPVERWFGIEILDHGSGSVDLKRLNRRASLLLEHRDHVGIVRKAWIDEDRKGRALVEFSPHNPVAQMIEKEVVDKYRPHVSVGYYPRKRKQERAADQDTGEPAIWRITRWEPVEISSVSVPADPSVGVGRAMAEAFQRSVVIETDGQAVTEEREMPKPVTDAGQEGAAAGTAATTVEVPPDDRAKKLVELTEAYGRQADLGRWIREGKSAAEAKDEILEGMKGKGAALGARESLGLDIPKKDRKRYSFARAIYGAYEETVPGSNVGFDGVEREIHEELVLKYGKQAHRHGGFLMPLDMRNADERERDREIRERLLLSRAYPLDSATATEGAELKFTLPGELIELLRTRTYVMQLGARVLSDLIGAVGMPRQSGAGTASWLATEEASVTDSMLATQLVTLAAKFLMSTTGFTRGLLAQASFDVEEMVKADLAAINGRAVDKAVIHGSGAAGQPTGIYAASGVNVVDMGGVPGSVPTYAKMVDMIGAVADDNADLGSLAFMTTALMAARLASTLVASAAGSDMIWAGRFDDGRVAGYKGVATNQVSKVMLDSAETGGTQHGIIFGNWQEVLIGFWGAMEVIVDPYSQKKAGGRIEVTTFLATDIQLRHAESFCKSHKATLA